MGFCMCEAKPFVSIFFQIMFFFGTISEINTNTQAKMDEKTFIYKTNNIYNVSKCCFIPFLFNSRQR